MRRPSPDEMVEEMARLAYHLHWSLDDVMRLEHAERRRYLAEAEAIAAAQRG